MSKQKNESQLSTFNKLFFTENNQSLFYSCTEFLNIINTLVFIFFLNFYTFQYNHADKIIVCFVDSCIIISSLLYISINKEIIADLPIVIGLGVIVITVSKVICILSMTQDVPLTRSILNYITLNFIIFCIPFLLSYSYYKENSQFPSKLFYMILGFILSCVDYDLVTKIRCVLYAINFFEFLPLIRKHLAQSYTKCSFFVYNTYIAAIMIYMNNAQVVLLMIGLNSIFILLYSLIMLYLYSEKDIK